MTCCSERLFNTNLRSFPFLQPSLSLFFTLFTFLLFPSFSPAVRLQKYQLLRSIFGLPCSFFGSIFSPCFVFFPFILPRNTTFYCLSLCRWGPRHPTDARPNSTKRPVHIYNNHCTASILQKTKTKNKRNANHIIRVSTRKKKPNQNGLLRAVHDYRVVSRCHRCRRCRRLLFGHPSRRHLVATRPDAQALLQQCQEELV